MYTVVYQMRRDLLGEHHASLPVLLNMMGSMQIKRGELEELLEVYELGLMRRRRRRESDGGVRNDGANTLIKALISLSQPITGSKSFSLASCVKFSL